uniref:Uncharacterized protein n=1 Tax=Attheya septentrionalis TaxID=420275 RepID=A0A7S2XTH6_9STRA
MGCKSHDVCKIHTRNKCERSPSSPIPRRIPRRKHTGPEKFQQPAMVDGRRRRDRDCTWDALVETYRISTRAVQSVGCFGKSWENSISPAAIIGRHAGTPNGHRETSSLSRRALRHSDER